MRRFLFGNIKIYTYLCKKLSYTPCYVYVKFNHSKNLIE
jgi:hypothetical protein